MYGWYGFTWFGYNIVDLYPLYLFVKVRLSIIASPTVQCLKRCPEPHKAQLWMGKRRSATILLVYYMYVYYMYYFTYKPNRYDRCRCNYRDLYVVKTGNLLWPYVDTHYTHFRNEKSGEFFFDKLKCIPLIIGLNYFL